MQKYSIHNERNIYGDENANIDSCTWQGLESSGTRNSLNPWPKVREKTLLFTVSEHGSRCQFLEDSLPLATNTDMESPGIQWLNFQNFHQLDIVILLHKAGHSRAVAKVLLERVK